MKAAYQHIDLQFESSFRLERFDQANPCKHNGLHLHHGYEIVYVKSGKGTIKVEDKEVHYDDGTLVLIGPSIPHFGFSNTTYPDNFEVVIHFDDEFVQNRIGAFPEFSSIHKLIESSKRILVFDCQTKKEVTPLFDRITKLNPTEQLISIFELLSKLSKVKTHQSLLGKDLGEHFAQSKQIKKVFDFINENFHSQISTRDIAAQVSLTTNSFCRMFKNLTGKSFITYLNDYRIHRATLLLEVTDASISQIMRECGFENPSYFARVFFQAKKLQPTEYRNNIRKSKLSN